MDSVLSLTNSLQSITNIMKSENDYKIWKLCTTYGGRFEFSSCNNSLIAQKIDTWATNMH